MKKYLSIKSMLNIKLRQYQTPDQDAVWQLHVDGLKQTDSYIDNRKYDEDMLDIKGTYLDNAGEFFVVSLDNKVVGMGGLLKMNNEIAEVKRMRVNSAYQKKGIGSSILESLIKRAEELGYKKLELDTTENMDAARRLYEKYGFKEFKRGRAGHLESIFYELELY
jgi:ribosomal protein S18 acetylase RimI-like enzyme